MKVAVAMLTRGGLSGGVRKHLQELAPRWGNHSGGPDVCYFLPDSPEVRGWWASELPARFWEPTPSYRGPKVLAAAMREWSPDVVFVPTARWIPGMDVPVVTMVRNMEPLCPPPGVRVPFLESLVNRIRRRDARRAVRNAQGVVCVSGFAEEFVRKEWAVPAARTRLIPHGAGPQLAPDEVVRPGTLTSGVRPGEFLFTLGSIRPYRALEDIIHAAAALQARGMPTPVLVGGADEGGSGGYPSALRGLVQRTGVESLVHWLGPLQREEVGWCFRHARAFVMTSRVEACPNVVLESMVYGTPSISNTSRPMPEFYGDAALYYPPGDADALADEVSRIVKEPQTRSRLAHAAHVRGKEFTWDRTATETLAFLRDVYRAAKP